MKHFKLSEFDCKHTGRNDMQPRFLAQIDKLREKCGFPFIINSGYRDPSHPVEAAKAKPGTHARGIAADIRVNGGAQRLSIVTHAIELGFTGIGVHDNFVHVDIRDDTPVLWCY